jgi:phosphate-selective porin OprO and OprP
MRIHRATRVFLCPLVLAVFTAGAWAQDGEASETEQLRAELDALRAEVTELKKQQNDGDTWLDERRAEEVKALVREVIADADQRASLHGGSMGITDDGTIRLLSSDGSFEMRIGGQLQLRGIGSVFTDDDASDNRDEFGFQIARAKLTFDGHVADPRLTYHVKLSAKRDSGKQTLEEATLGYDLGGGFGVVVGRNKLPFLRSEMVSFTKLLAVDRAAVTEFFTLDRAEKLQVNYAGDWLRAAAAFSDGGDTDATDFGEDPVEFALTGRADVKLAGSWKQAKDITAWPDDEMGLFLGVAGHHENGDGNNGRDYDYSAYTLDALFNYRGGSLLAAFTHGFVDGDRNDGVDNRQPYGILVEGGYHVSKKLEPFARWEYLDPDAAGTEPIQIVTAGANYYFRKHNLKFTGDVVYVYEGAFDTSTDTIGPGNNPFSSGLGLSEYKSGEDLVVFRSQIQLLF